jgi:hypothetical protein
VANISPSSFDSIDGSLFSYRSSAIRCAKDSSEFDQVFISLKLCPSSLSKGLKAI